MSTLHDYFYQLAEQALNESHPVPPAPTPPCALESHAQANNKEPAGSPSIDWALDTRPSHRLSDAELLDKMRWHLAALNSREQLLRAFERLVPTIHPESK